MKVDVHLPQTTLFKYDALIQKLSLDIDCLTKDGISMQIEVDIQGEFQKHQYLTYGMNLVEKDRLINIMN